jgi:hypothetical protein
MRPVLPAEEHREGREDTNRKITQANRIVRLSRLEECAGNPCRCKSIQPAYLLLL